MNKVFYVVATPIGNLDDITLRALEVLKKVDLILCEDTRHSKILLQHYHINTPILSYHQHSRLQKTNYIIKQVADNKTIALITDAGTPGISDPGNKLVKQLLQHFVNQSSLQNNQQIKIIPIPGPSAVTTALSVSGLPTDHFIFWGFLPTKKRKQQILENISQSKYTSIFYESPHRLIKTIKIIAPLINDRKIIVFRELTKKFETIYRETGNTILDNLSQIKIKGEFVVAIEAKK
ncbi:MAG: 16S rRNA (cytidine(1402)-2'-O)-methyltransferase [Candidatus Aenigmarchaeota archaeon]|nr:16S rRNA (cytidine(1402)-2'-O)-methyltransferase [Candidatus Aenigmarchaeota archaeon]